ncbi:hypothetical protein PMZ80_010283 [Knufia obscura]|uniref:ATP-grasp domain-containing protein n=1 Tax=Knufia obscura TaxID=1635080 RepID=A0ABR0RAN2_9EURO|nr:hypothetical protein PMZ80_010283 [Knufia obscura]
MRGRPRPTSRLLSSQTAYNSAPGAAQPKVAVLHQAIEPPVINGMRKPMKPGGYEDSGADILFGFQKAGTAVVTPTENPSATKDEGWCFPDTESGILEAVSRGATHLWANTILFASHPLQTSKELSQYASTLRVVGQPPQLVEQYDDKNFVNELLRRDGSFDLPRSCLVRSFEDALFNKLKIPIVAKPLRGRGSQGVFYCENVNRLVRHVEYLLEDYSTVMLEEYLSGEEGTVTVLPPSSTNPEYSALPIVLRFNHEEGIAPYSGKVAVLENSRVLSMWERNSDSSYLDIEKACERVAAKLNVTAPIRIDVRRFSQNKGSKFAIFDVNMKPNMTGPGRPRRENQASLTALAASAVGWDYPQLLQEILASAQTLQHLRSQSLP